MAIPTVSARLPHELRYEQEQAECEKDDAGELLGTLAEALAHVTAEA